MSSIIWKNRAFIFYGSLSDLKYRYAGTTFKYLWNFLIPLLQVLVYAFIFTKIITFKSPHLMKLGTPYIVYLCSGILPWINFNRSIASSTQSLTMNAKFLKKLPIPEQVFIAKDSFSFVITGFIYMVIFVCFILILGEKPSKTWLYIPLLVILFQGFSFGIGLFMGTLHVFFKDVSQALTVLIQVAFWLTPIVYFKDNVPEKYQVFLHLNPLFYFVDSFHEVIVFRTPPSLLALYTMFMLIVLTATIGYLFLRILRSDLRDNL